MTLAEMIVDSILGDMDDRKGFDHWWHGIDEEIQEEIKEDLEAKVEKILKANSR